VSAAPQRAFGAGVLLLMTSPIVVAAPQSARAETTPAPVAAAAVAIAAPEPYKYDPQGRRDPFVSLIGRGADETAAPGGHRADGLQGLSTVEVSLRGVMQSRGGYVAIVQGPDQKTHLVRPNDRLLDGTVKSISPQGLVILQEVNDPLSLVKQKEIRKTLHGSDEGK
jgi:Tfp pilus assembly protein PilP